MQVLVNTDHIEQAKAILREKLSNVTSAHRTEALARGLGWRTNAAMREDLAKAPPEGLWRPTCVLNFGRYLEQAGFGRPSSVLMEDAVLRTQMDRARWEIAEILKVHPTLVYKRDEFLRSLMKPQTILTDYLFATDYLWIRTNVSPDGTINHDTRDGNGCVITPMVWRGLLDVSLDISNGYKGLDSRVDHTAIILAAARLGILGTDSVTTSRYIQSRMIPEGDDSRVWHNLMNHAINTAIEQGIFGLGPNEDWGDGNWVRYPIPFQYMPLKNDLWASVYRDPGEYKNNGRLCILIWDTVTGGDIAYGHLNRTGGTWLENPGPRPFDQMRFDNAPRKHAIFTELTNMWINSHGYCANGPKTIYMPPLPRLDEIKKINKIVDGFTTSDDSNAQISNPVAIPDMDFVGRIAQFTTGHNQPEWPST